MLWWSISEDLDTAEQKYEQAKKELNSTLEELDQM